MIANPIRKDSGTAMQTLIVLVHVVFKPAPHEQQDPWIGSLPIFRPHLRAGMCRAKEEGRGWVYIFYRL